MGFGNGITDQPDGNNDRIVGGEWSGANPWSAVASPLLRLSSYWVRGAGEREGADLSSSSST